MKHKSFGFTLVEIALFLAVTGALFIGIMVGTQNSIRAQRYNDSVQSFANFWRDIYASVSNTQNINQNDPGRSKQAIYGKLIVFGESRDLTGAPTNTEATGQKIFYYDVIGDIIKAGSNADSTLKALASLNSNVLDIKMNTNGTADIFPSGLVDSYTPTWGAIIEKARTNYSSETWPFTGSILVVKHPRSTTIGTFVSSKIIQVNDYLTGDGTNAEQAKKLLTDLLNLNSANSEAFKESQIDFCINSDDIGQARFRRQDVRLVKNANNVSGVEILSADNPNNPCTNSEAGT